MKRIFIIIYCLLLSLCIYAAKQQPQKYRIVFVNKGTVSIAGKSCYKNSEFYDNDIISFQKGQIMGIKNVRTRQNITVSYKLFHKKKDKTLRTVAEYIAYCNNKKIPVARAWRGNGVDDDFFTLEKSDDTFMLKRGEKRIALLVGNNNYLNYDTLSTPDQDAYALTEALQELGFDTYTCTDLRKKEFDIALESFVNSIYKDNYTVSLLYLAGHGMIDNRANSYFLPVDASKNDTLILENKNILDIDSILRRTKSNINIILFDACRTSSKTNMNLSIGRGNVIDNGEQYGDNTIVMYSTTSGKGASDFSTDGSSNGPFARAFMQLAGNPHRNIKRTLEEIKKLTSIYAPEEQEPQIKGGTPDFSFRPKIHGFSLGGSLSVAPSMSIDGFLGYGAKLRIEIGSSIGLSSSPVVYVYEEGTIKNVFEYRGYKLWGRLGYDIMPFFKKYTKFEVIPFVGLSCNWIEGKAPNSFVNSNSIGNKASVLTIPLQVRTSYTFFRRYKTQAKGFVSAGCEFTIKEDTNYMKLRPKVNDFCDKWSRGFSLQCGIIYNIF